MKRADFSTPVRTVTWIGGDGFNGERRPVYGTALVRPDDAVPGRTCKGYASTESRKLSIVTVAP